MTAGEEWLPVIQLSVLLLMVLVGIPVWLCQERLFHRLEERHPELYEAFGRPTLRDLGPLRRRLRLVRFYWSASKQEVLGDDAVMRYCRLLRLTDSVEVVLLVAYLGAGALTLLANWR